MSATFATVVGVPSPAVWSTVWTKEYEDRVITVVISIAQVDAAGQGKALLATMDQMFEDPPTQEELLSLLQKYAGHNVQIAAALIQGESVLVFAMHGAAVYMQRQAEGSFIIPANHPVHSMRGQIQEGDTLIVATQAFFTTFSSDLVSDKTPTERADAVARMVPGLTVSDALAAWFYQLAAKPATSSVTPQPSGNTPAEEQPATVPSTLRETHPPRKTHRLARKAHLIARLRTLGLGALILLIVCGVVIGANRLMTSRRDQAIAQTLAPLSTELQAIEAMDASARVEQLKRLEDVGTTIDTLRREQSRNKALLIQLQEVSARRDALVSKISGEKQIGRLQVYFDFRLVAPDFIGGAVAHDIPGKLAIFLDAEHGRLLSLSLEKKQTQVLRIDEQVQRPFGLAVAARKAYILGENGIGQVSLPLDVPGAVVVPKGEFWQQPHMVGTFGQNLYMLDIGQRGLYLYDLSEPDASPSAWFRSKEGIDFATLSSMAIDGTVWLGTTNGQVLKFSRGEREDFTFSQLARVPDSTVFLYTSEDTNNLYILEPRAKRLLVVSKEGVYQSSVVSDDLATTTGLIVDEETKIAYVLAGSLVYEVPLP